VLQTLEVNVLVVVPELEDKVDEMPFDVPLHCWSEQPLTE